MKPTNRKRLRISPIDDINGYDEDGNDDGNGSKSHNSTNDVGWDGGQLTCNDDLTVAAVLFEVVELTQCWPSATARARTALIPKKMVLGEELTFLQPSLKIIGRAQKYS